MKTPEEILTKLSKERGYPSFPALIENELSLDVYDLVCKAMKTPEEKYIEMTATKLRTECRNKAKELVKEYYNFVSGWTSTNKPDENPSAHYEGEELVYSRIFK